MSASACARRTLWLAATAVVALGAAPTFAGSHGGGDASAGTRPRIEGRMAGEMNALRAEMNLLKAQMDRIALVTDRSQRQALIKSHLASLRRATTRLHAMALQMIEDVDQGRIVSDRSLADRHRMLAEQNAMALAMLEQAIECDAPSGR